MDWLVASTIKTSARFLATYHYKKMLLKTIKWCKGAVSDNTSKPLGYFLYYKKKSTYLGIDALSNDRLPYVLNNVTKVICKFLISKHF